MMALCEGAASEGVSVALLGGKDERVLALLSSKLRSTGFPNLKLAYTFSPPFRQLSENEDASLVRDLNQSGAKLLFVGLGCPKQERWDGRPQGSGRGHNDRAWAPPSILMPGSWPHRPLGYTTQVSSGYIDSSANLDGFGDDTSKPPHASSGCWRWIACAALDVRATSRERKRRERITLILVVCGTLILMVHGHCGFLPSGYEGPNLFAYGTT